MVAEGLGLGLVSLGVRYVSSTVKIVIVVLAMWKLTLLSMSFTLQKNKQKHAFSAQFHSMI